jgi:hypothetical protein
MNSGISQDRRRLADRRRRGEVAKKVDAENHQREPARAHRRWHCAEGGEVHGAVWEENSELGDRGEGEKEDRTRGEKTKEGSGGSDGASNRAYP